MLKKGQTNQIIVLSLGLLISFLVGITIFRSYIVALINSKILNDLGEEHTFSIIGIERKAKKILFLETSIPIIRIIIPCIFVPSFVVAVILISNKSWIV